MMAGVPIRVSCTACSSNVRITADDVTLMLCSSDADRSYYKFPCPDCGTIVRKEADADTARLLMVEAKVTPTVWALPAEILEPRTGPAITHDDVLDAHLAFEAADYLAPVAAALIGA